MIHDIFVVGVKDDRLGERILVENVTELMFDLALTKVEAFVRAFVEHGAVV